MHCAFPPLSTRPLHCPHCTRHPRILQMWVTTVASTAACTGEWHNRSFFSTQCCMLVQGLLGQCLEGSRLMTLKLYQRPLLTPQSYISFYKRCNTRLNREQLSALAALYSWRDRMCRSLDESPGRFLPKRLLLILSSQMPEHTSGVMRIAGRHKTLLRYAKEVWHRQPLCLPNPVVAIST